MHFHILTEHIEIEPGKDVNIFAPGVYKQHGRGQRHFYVDDAEVSEDEFTAAFQQVSSEEHHDDTTNP